MENIFNTPLSHFQYIIMPFGLTKAMVSEVINDMLNRFIFVHLDDILIFSVKNVSSCHLYEFPVLHD